MAPMTRSNALVSLSDGLPLPPQPRYREASWQFVPPESRSERELSEEPASSYNESADAASRDGEEDYEYENPPPLTSPDDHEDILHPLREAANRVGREVERFAEVLDAYNPKRATADEERQEMMFDLIDHYHSVAKDTIQRLEKEHAHEIRKLERQSRRNIPSYEVPTSDDEMDIEESEQGSPYPEQQTNLRDLERWKQEAETWDLLRRLVQLRFASPTSAASTSDTPIHQYSTERDIWENFLETDKLALERRTVLQWLEETADDSREKIHDLVQDLQQNADRGEITAYGWIHTRLAVKQFKRQASSSGPLDPSSQDVQRSLFNSAGTEPLVTQLDPDATTRQNRRLEVQDEHFERSIWLACYEMLRRGWDPARIRETCEEYTEVWRAVSMSGFPDQRSEEDETSDDIGASSLWRRMCFTLARNGGGDDYERAVYGLLSGDISSVEPVCESWDDFLFTHYNALLRTQFDSYLEKVRPQNLKLLGSVGVFDAVQFHGEVGSAGKRLIANLRSDPRTSHETMQPMKMLQGVLIANDFSNFIYQQGLALSKFANATGLSSLIPPTAKQPENEDVTKYIALDDHDSLRVFTHVLLIFMGLGLDLGGVFREMDVENIIVAYISFLRLAGKEELIPLYSSQLSGERRYAILCRNLIDVTDHEQRVTQIKLMRELGLDVQKFVEYQARYLVDDYKDTVSGFPASGNFKLFDDALVPRGSYRGVRRDFFGDDPDKIDRIDMLLIRSLEWYLLVDGMWSQTFYVGTMLYVRFFKHMHLNAARKLAVRVPAGMIAQVKTRAILGDSFDFDGLESGEDEDLTEVLDGSADQKKLLRKHLLDEARNYRELEWLIECLDNIETVASMESLVKEKTQQPNTIGKSWRQELASAFKPTKISVQPLLKEDLEPDLRLLREAYLPETLLAYITSLQFAGQKLSREFLLECMNFSTLVADEDSDLLEVFMRTGRMQELVEILAFASKNLLLVTSEKPGSSTSKKMRMKGQTHELWSVKPKKAQE
ncbi:related to Nuclear pore complex protein Nup107 [Phialocephala subalpina]|uniref:Nuclear pore complex protein n=1 Tax=Phialocephala subalpina TaxID=576137 RepID=A0A1L7XYJ4_9HELO|nr:related to Nuclear pore complex protein Nup107 [Phialocephala subalpina]